MVETLKSSEDLLKNLADQTRIRLLRLLLVGGETCVCELVDSLNLPQYTVSRNLTALKRVGVLQEKRHGKWRYYQVNANASCLVKHILNALINDINDILLVEDMNRYMRRISCRVDGKCVVVNCCC